MSEHGRERLMARQLLASMAIVAALMAWWFPAPLLVRGELVQWSRLYENRFAPSGSSLGATALGGAFVRSVTGPVPLTEFIASRIEGQVMPATDSVWTDVFAALQGSVDARQGTVFFDPEQPPFPALEPDRRYVQLQDEQGIRHMEYRFVPANDFEMHEIPPDVRYPLRRYWPLIAALGLGGILFGFAGGSGGGLVERSSAGKGLRWSAICAVGLMGMIMWPFVYRTVGAGLSLASIIMGGIFLIGALVAMWLFGRQAAMLRRMAGGAHLAHFTYNPDEWTRFVQWNFGEEASEKKALWWIIFAISLLIGLGFMAVMRDEASVWVFGVLMALMVVLRALAVGLPRLALGHHLARPGEVYVGEEGLFLNGTVHTWTGLGARLDDVALESAPLPHLRLVYSYLMVAGRSLYFFRNYVTVRIPVPEGREAEGKAVADKLNRALKADS
ncbi:MAG: hypothetical protein Q7J24_00160 [Desulfomicrobium sp.]|nr:hypothetical protein [Desulfomicrobium sp.]